MFHQYLSAEGFLINKEIFFTKLCFLYTSLGDGASGLHGPKMSNLWKM